MLDNTASEHASPLIRMLDLADSLPGAADCVPALTNSWSSRPVTRW
ncbi:hypothetical protein [Sinosporangium siamense]|uniref:Uncharacterized protein n=1 Tax=Sinosporangium siamense TaxID=1367973 RepID=A0A919RAN2_9ACTN|nr:hypothetical protein [Sinosporangium siamense]GII90460.1 hypothetical protein Ssi02_06910 [Sinosporangium siamense]